MTIKVPSAIKDIIDTEQGKEPVAFVDIFEEKGDYDIIDTQNQFKDVTDAAIANDFNVDFDRKPGFAVLAPGKKVDASTTAILFDWGNGLIDWSNTFDNLGNPFLTFSVTTTVNYGWSVINNIIVGVVFVNGNLYGTGTKFEAHVITSVDGKLFSPIYKIPDGATDFFTQGLDATHTENASNFDSYCVTPDRPAGGDIQYTTDGAVINTTPLTAITTIEGSPNWARINGVLSIGSNMILFGQFGGSLNPAIYSIDKATGSTGFKVLMPFAAGDVHCVTYNPADGLYYFVYADSLSNFYLGSSDLVDGASTVTVIKNFPAGEKVYNIRVLNNGNLAIPMFLNTATTSLNYYLFNILDLANPTLNAYPNGLNPSRFGINSATNGLVYTNAGGTYVGWTLDGVNHKIESVTSYAAPASLTNEPMSPLVDINSSYKLTSNFEVVNSNHISSAGGAQAGGFKYTVQVQDQYYTDSGRGKK